MRAALAIGCSYDVSRLEGHADAANDVVAMPDAIADDIVTCIPDIVLDTNPPDTTAGACSTRAAINANEVGSQFGGSLVISSDTTGAPLVVDPPDGTTCASGNPTSPTSELVYQYVVQSGPRLLATTDAPPCIGVFDTVLYIRTQCDPSDSFLACGDDDHVLNCGNALLASSAFADNLSPGEIVYIVIGGYRGNAGRFRLTLAENGLLDAPPPSVGTSMPGDRCGCPDGFESTVTNIGFPAQGDTVTSADGVTLANAGEQLMGTRMLGVTTVAGAALDFELVANQLGQGPGCANASLTLDLAINGIAVQSVVVDTQTLVGVPVRVPYQTFAPMEFVSTTTTVQVGLQVRSVGVTGCGGIQVDLSNAGTLTLLAN